MGATGPPVYEISIGELVASVASSAAVSCEEIAQQTPAAQRALSVLSQPFDHSKGTHMSDMHLS